MASSESGFPFNTSDSDTIQDGFLDSSNQFLEDFLDMKPTFMTSPDQSFVSLPDPDPAGHPWLQPSPSMIENFAVGSPSLNAHTQFDAYDWLSQPDIQSAQYHTPVFNSQDSGLMSPVMPTTHQPSGILNAGRSSMSQGYSSVVVNGTTPVHDAIYPPQIHFSPPGTTVPSYHNSSPMFVERTGLFNPEIGTPYEQMLLALDGVTLSSSSTPSEVAFQHMVPRPPIERIQHRNSRRDSSVTNHPYPPTRTSSLPVQVSSPAEEAVSHTCQWMKADDTICGAPITRGSVPKHLATHGVENLPNHTRVSCRWVRCRIKGNHNTLNRESIVRHVREKHLRYRRSL